MFNPRIDHWHDYSLWSNDGLLIIGQTSIGRATVDALSLSTDSDAITVRSYWILAGWHPPRN